VKKLGESRGWSSKELEIVDGVYAVMMAIGIYL
jgi:hypothetical protein